MIRDRLRAWLAQDGEAEPQARDERPIAVSRTEHTEEPSADDIQTWVDEYYANPLLRQPIRNFASDVMEPGVVATVNTDGEDVPTVTDDYPIARYRGMGLDEALDGWLSEAAITGGGQFNRDVADLLEDALKDKRGRRGSALIEHAYDDPEERDYILGLRLFKTETVTAYTWEGKAILLRPDDEPDADEFETVAVQNFSGSRDESGAPSTPATKTAAFVQYDDVFSQFSERDDIPFALDDVTFIPNDVDTGRVFGKPDTASVVDEAKAIRDQFDKIDDAIATSAFGNWVVRVDTDDEDEAKDLLSGLDPQDGDSPIQVVNYGIDEVEEVFGDFPDVTDAVQQQIEHILAALPTPLYRVGFAGDINRDITTEQRQDYRDEIRRERALLESHLRPLIVQKAKEFLFNDAKSDQELDVRVGVKIKPEESESPLEDEEFEPEDFAKLMQGAKAAAPGGATEQILPPHEVREKLLGLDPEPPEPPDDDGVDAAAALPDETDERVRETFRDAYLGTRYSEGDVVQSPQGLGVVTEVRTEDFEGKDGTVEASSDSPTYVVALKDARVGVGFYKASQLDATEMPDTGIEDPADDLQAAANIAHADADAELAETTFELPDSWEESPKPNRLILLDAWASMGGQFDCGGGCCMGELKSERLCGSMKDRVLQWEGWRKGG